MKSRIVSWLVAFLSGATAFAFCVCALTYMLNFDLEYALLLTAGIDVTAIVVFGAMGFIGSLPEPKEKNRKSIDKKDFL